MQSRIVGTTLPVLEFTLEPNESVVSEAGELSWMSSSIQLETHTQFGGGGGIFGALKRVAGGGSLFMTEYRAIGARGEIAFATRVPGHIQPECSATVRQARARSERVSSLWLLSICTKQEHKKSHNDRQISSCNASDDIFGIAVKSIVEKPSHLSSEYGCLFHKTNWIVERVFRIK